MKRISEEMRRDLSKALGVALERLAQGAEQRFREGNKSLLLQTLCIHIGLDLPIPKWAKDAFLNACISQPKHWDNVFGRPEGPQKKRSCLHTSKVSDYARRGDQLVMTVSSTTSERKFVRVAGPPSGVTTASRRRTTTRSSP
jgi:hypothetical protein